MRISCEYKTSKIPVSYHMLGVSLIKEALKKNDIEFFKRIYCFDENKANKKSKDFCFSVFLKDYQKEGDVFLINDRVIFNFSSPDYNFMVNLYNGLLKINEFAYKEFNLNKARISLIKEKVVSKPVVKFTTLSAIHIKDKYNNALDIKDENFVKELNYITDLSLRNYRGYGLNKELKFIPSPSMKKRVIKQDIRNFKEKTAKTYYYVNSYVGDFILEGDTEDLQDIYLLGVGFKRNQGFGMIEIIG